MTPRSHLFPSSGPRGAPRPSRVKIGRSRSVSGGYFQGSKASAWCTLARTLVLLASLLAALAGAASASAAGPTATNTPTATPTNTPAPTTTDRPYPTQVPYPTQIPYPTQTPPSPALTLSQAQGVTGTALVASATHFPAGEVSLYLDDAPTVLGRAIVDDAGHARIDFAISHDAGVGGHEVRAVGANRTSAHALFTVTRPQGAVVDSGGSGSATYCTGLLGWCPDLGGLIGGVVGAAWGAVTGGLNGKMQDLSDAILSPIVTTPNLRTNQELTRVQGILSQDATEAVVVLFGIAAMWCAKPSFFGEFEQGLSLLLRSGLVVAALRTLNPLMTVWTDLVNAMASGVGHGNIANTGQTGAEVVVAPILFVAVGLERSISLYTLGLAYALAPVFIVLVIWPPAHRLFVSWLFLFVSTSTLGLAYSLATTMVVAMGVNAPGIWGAVMTIGGLFFLAAVPAIWGGLTLAAGQGGSGALGKVANVAKLALL